MDNESGQSSTGIYLQPGYNSLGGRMTDLCECGCGEAYHAATVENGPRDGHCRGPVHRHLGPGGNEEHCPTKCKKFSRRAGKLVVS